MEAFKPIGFVEALRPHAEDDFWGGEEACIRLIAEFTADSLQGLGGFSHVEVIYLFHEVDIAKIVTGARHPRTGCHLTPPCSSACSASVRSRPCAGRAPRAGRR